MRRRAAVATLPGRPRDARHRGRRRPEAPPLRRALTFVGLLAVAGLVAFAPAPRASADGGGAERQDPLAVADQLERDGRAHLEQGHKAEGAKLLSKAWAIRAEVFAQQDRKSPKPPEGEARAKPQDPPELEALMARVAELKARAGAAEREGKELKEAGKGELAAAKMEESGRLWREAKALQAKVEALRAAKAQQPTVRFEPGGDLRLEWLETARGARVVEVRPDGDGDALSAIHRKLEQVLGRMEKMQQRLEALERRLEKAEKDD